MGDSGDGVVWDAGSSLDPVGDDGGSAADPLVEAVCAGAAGATPETAGVRVLGGEDGDGRACVRGAFREVSGALPDGTWRGLSQSSEPVCPGAVGVSVSATSLAAAIAGHGKTSPGTHVEGVVEDPRAPALAATKPIPRMTAAAPTAVRGSTRRNQERSLVA